MKVLIRPLTIEDSSISWKWRNDPEIWRYTGSKPDKFITEEIEKEWLQKKLLEEDSARFAILVDDLYVGNVQLTNIIQLENAEYHIFIGEKKYWGKGIAGLATKQIFRFAANILNLKEIYLKVDPEHRNAIRVYKKCGFNVINTSVESIEMRVSLVNRPQPTVSVFVMTYNHEKYISQAIEGMLMQKTSFDFDIVIGEDFSTDNTRDIVLHYQAKHPGKFKLLLHKKNIGAMANQIAVLSACAGKYIAMCEGDDYWIDPHKLQKQVDFLEAHPEYGLVHADCDFYYVDSGTVLYAVNKFRNIKNVDSSRDDLFDQLISGSYKIRTATVLFRKSLHDMVQAEIIKISHMFLMGDTPMWLEMSQHTRFYYMEDVVAMYRVLSQSASRSQDRKKQLRFGLSMAEMRVYFVKKYRDRIPEHLRKRYNKALLLHKAAEPTYDEMYPLICPILFEKLLFKLIHQPSLRFVVPLWFRASGLTARTFTRLQEKLYSPKMRIPQKSGRKKFRN